MPDFYLQYVLSMISLYGGVVLLFSLLPFIYIFIKRGINRENIRKKWMNDVVFLVDLMWMNLYSKRCVSLAKEKKNQTWMYVLLSCCCSNICNGILFVFRFFFIIFICVISMRIKPCRAAVGVVASFRFWLPPHLNNDTDGRRSMIGCGASTSHGCIDSDKEAPIGPQRGSERMRLIDFLVFFVFFFWFHSIL